MLSVSFLILALRLWINRRTYTVTFNSLPDELARIWRKWIDDLEKIKSIAIPRSYFYRIEVEIVSHALHGFADASLIGYCSVVYLVYRTVANMYFSELVCSKSKVNPVVKLTLPKLELLPALILARLMNTVKTALSDEIPHFEQVICWSDNRSALFWIKSTKSHEYKKYVRNRVNEILDLTDRNMWHHCPTSCNPADVGSRGQFPSEQKRNFLWLNGPSWLFGPPENYPVDLSVSQLEAAEKNIASLKLKSKNTSVLLSVPDEKSFPSISAVIDASSYSSHHRLLNVTVYVLRFIHNLKARIKKDTDNIMCGRITVEEIKAVETLWLFDTQKRFRSLESFKKIEQSLGVYVDDDGLLRCRGRLGNAPVPEESKFSILLPRDSYVTDLIVRNCHQQVLHSGVNDTLNEIRSRFWITRGRQFVKKILHKCVVCRKVLGPSYKLPAPPHLPSFRVCGGPAFDNVGTDYAGPLYIKDPSDTSRSIKAYIAIFTCCTSRNIHLELLQSMEAETFLMCLRRFVSRRGIPSLIVSDNTQNFKTSKNILKEIFDSEKVRSYLLQKKIDWDFIQAKSPWWGGFYERLIQVVKRVLRKLLGNARLSYEELLTVLTESECTINSRPLTHMTSDEFDRVPLTHHRICYMEGGFNHYRMHSQILTKFLIPESLLPGE